MAVATADAIYIVPRNRHPAYSGLCLYQRRNPWVIDVVNALFGVFSAWNNYRVCVDIFDKASAIRLAAYRQIGSVDFHGSELPTICSCSGAGIVAKPGGCRDRVAVRLQ